jgi:hypothetical protein
MKQMCAALAALLVNGCAGAGTLRELVGIPADDGASAGDVDKAVAQGDWAFVGKVCREEVKAAQAPRRAACEADEQHAREQGYAATMAAGCDDVLQKFRAVRSLDRAKDDELFLAVAKKLGSCGRYRELFESMVHREQAGVQALVAIEQAGLPLLAELTRYVDASGPAFLADQGLYAMHNIGLWMLEKGHLDQCPLTVRAATAAGDAVVAGAINYLVAAKCAEGAPLFARALRTDSTQLRTRACNALAKLGTAAQLDVVGAAADADPAVDVVERNGYGVRVYPVRDACAHARAQIQLRAAR